MVFLSHYLLFSRADVDFNFVTDAEESTENANVSKRNKIEHLFNINYNLC